MTLDAVPTGWLAVGFLGQAMFTSRFVLQWIASERHKQSIIPPAFWWCSVAGGLTLFIYAIHRHDPVFILGQGAGLLIYARNLMLLRRPMRGTADQRNAGSLGA